MTSIHLSAHSQSKPHGFERTHLQRMSHMVRRPGGDVAEVPYGLKDEPSASEIELCRPRPVSIIRNNGDHCSLALEQ